MRDPVQEAPNPRDDRSCDERTRSIDAMYRAEGPRLTRMLRAKLRGSDDPRDVLQEAFARFAARARQVALRNPEAYLQRVVRNLLIDRSRRAARHGLFVDLDDAGELAVDPDQAQLIEVEQMRAQYRFIVDDLPPRTREVFLLHRASELSYTEIAAQLGISVRTVEWHIGQAISHIGRRLER